MEPRNSIEQKIINDFISHAQNTHKTSLTNSAAMALRHLYAYYGEIINDEMALQEKTKINDEMILQEKTIRQALESYTPKEEITSQSKIIVKEAQILGKYEKCMKEIFAEAPQDKIAACQNLASLANESCNEHDMVTLYGEDKPCIIPLKHVVSLVWFALNDDKQYDHNLVELDESLRKEEAKKHRRDRLDSFYKRLEDFRKDSTCHQGVRNDLVFLLNKSYRGMDLIEDEKAAVLSFIKDKLVFTLLSSYENKSVNIQQLNKDFLHWIIQNDPQPLITTLQLDLHKDLHALFVQHGIHPDIVKNLIDQVLPSVTYSCDMEEHPGLYHVNALFQICKELPNQANANHALKIARNFVYEIDDFKNEKDINKVETFNHLFSAYAQLLKNKNLLIMTGKLSPEILELEESIQSYLLSVKKTLPEELVSDKQISSIETLLNTISLCKQDPQIDQVSNFFFKYFNAKKESDKTLLAAQYNLLLSPDFQKSINDAIIPLLQTYLNTNGDLYLGPYEVNLVFLYAISNHTGKWHPVFANFLEKTTDFVRTQFNQDETQIASQLKRESYPDNLIHQMDYLCKKYSRKSENPRPAGMLVLPDQIQTADEWIAISELLKQIDGQTFESTYQRYAAQINRLLKKHSDIEESLIGIPPEYRLSFLNSFSNEELKEKIKTGYVLWKTLLQFPEEKRKDVIAKFGNDIKNLIECVEISSILNLLTEEDQSSFAELMTDKLQNFDDLESLLQSGISLDHLLLFSQKIKDIINDGRKLYKILKPLNAAGRQAVIDVLYDNIPDILQNSEELEKVLFILSSDPGPQRLVLMALGNKTKNMIQDGDQLAGILNPLPIALQMRVINQLKPNLNQILKTPDQILKVSKEIKDEKECVTFVTMFKDKISNGHHIFDFLYPISETNRLASLRTLWGDNILEKFNDHTLFVAVLRLLPEKDRIIFIKSQLVNEKNKWTCITLLGKNVKEISSNGEDFTDILNLLCDAEKNLSNSFSCSLRLIKNLDHKLIDLMKDNTDKILNKDLRNLVNYTCLIHQEVQEIEDEKPSICFFGVNPEKGDFTKDRRLRALNALLVCLLTYSPDGNNLQFDNIEEDNLEVLKDGVIFKKIYSPMCKDLKIGMTKQPENAEVKNSQVNTRAWWENRQAMNPALTSKLPTNTYFNIGWGTK